MRFRPANISLINSRFPLADDSGAVQKYELKHPHKPPLKISSLNTLDWSFHTRVGRVFEAP